MLEVKNKNIEKAIDNHCKYVNCVFLVAKVVKIENSEFVNCSFRSKIEIELLEKCKFTNCNFLCLHIKEQVETIIEKCIFPQIEGLPDDISVTSWNGEYFDFTTTKWARLSREKQTNYAKIYKNWYAQQKKLSLTKDIVIKKDLNGGFEISIPIALIPPGKFWMGSPENEKYRNDNEKRHLVLLTKAFYFAKTPTTQKQWFSVMGENPSYFRAGLNAPVEKVGYVQGVEFCKKIGARLPTEAEWEYACRAGTLGARYGEIDKIAWYSNNSEKQTHPVAEKLANAWELYDMLGNVWEWCNDWYGDYDTLPKQGDTVINPEGAITGSFAVQRGGSFEYFSRVRAAYRSTSNAFLPQKNMGFRCVFEM